MLYLKIMGMESMLGDEKYSEQLLTQTAKVKTFYVIINSELKKKLEQILYGYYNFESILFNIINKNYNLYKEGLDTNDFYLLTSPQLIKNILYYYNYQNSDQMEYIKNKYKNNKLWQELKDTAKMLNPHNLTYIIERVRTAFDIYSNSLELYEQNPNLFQVAPIPPVVKDLSHMTNYSIELDKYNSLSFVRLEKDNLVGINLSDHMVYIPVNNQAKKLIETERLYSVKVAYDDGDLYLQINYLKELYKTEKYKVKYEAENEKIKFAGIDIGERNLMAVFIDDETTPSLLVDGKPFKRFSDIETLIEQFLKMTKLVIEYLHLYEVTDIFTSKNLANKKFMQIPLIKLIDAIEHEAQTSGIKVHYVNESYTSKASCISDDINNIIENSINLTNNSKKHKSIRSIIENLHLSNVFSGKRKGELFFDTVINEKFNADLNATVNHIKVGTGKSFEWLKDKLFKLNDPIKIKSDQEFEKLLMNLKKSKSSKSVTNITKNT